MKRPAGLLFLLTLTVWAATPRAVAQEKETPPKGTPPKPFHSPTRVDFQLPNKMRATMARYGLIPKINIQLVFTGGNLTEPADKQGLSDLMGELLKEGTTSRTAEQVAEEAAALGGSINVAVTPDQIMIQGEALSEGAGKLVNLIADVALHPKFPDSELARIKKDQLRNIAIMKSLPSAMAAEAFLKVVYGDNGYGRAFPEQAALESVTIDDIRAFYAKHFVPANARLYVTGVFDDSLRPVITSAFASWSGGPPPTLPKVKAQTKRALELVDRPGAPQSTIYLGLPVMTPEQPDYIPFEVANSLLGGSFMSRITSNIREQKGYTYSPRSTIETNAQNAVWAEHADVTTKFTGASLTEIYKEVDQLRKQPPPAKELEGIQNALAGVFILRNSSRQGIIATLRFIDLHHLPANYIDTYLARVYQVKPSDVQGLAEKYIDPNKMTVVVVGDQKEIESQVAPFRPAP